MNVIIAGATGDIGKAIAKALSSEHNLLLLYRDEAKRKILERDLKATNIQFFSIKDLFQKSESVLSEFTTFSPDAFINAIGDGFYAKVEETTLEIIDASYEANFKVPFYLTQIVYKVFLNQKRGYIIFINSVSGLEGFPYGVAYCSFKFALRGLAEVMYKEGKRYGIKVSTVYPGIVKTRLLQKMPFLPKEKDLLPPEEVAKAVKYLLTLHPTAEVKDLVLKNKELSWR
ncbi:MAG: SDR family oxidoreductase [Candidatus Desulfofervidaceae bacterium]|nr:SDR family oxidoreductase [Candidatus Desulfofervidaceae bacterium]